MSSRFVISAEGLPSDAEASFIDYLRKKRLQWWHRIPGVWLIIDQGEIETVQTIRSALKTFSQAPNYFIMEIPVGHVDWCGTKVYDDMFSWVKAEWNSPDAKKKKIKAPPAEPI